MAVEESGQQFFSWLQRGEKWTESSISGNLVTASLTTEHKDVRLTEHIMIPKHRCLLEDVCLHIQCFISCRGLWRSGEQEPRWWCSSSGHRHLVGDHLHHSLVSHQLVTRVSFIVMGPQTPSAYTDTEI